MLHTASHYDTVFIVGDFYLSSLTFRHSLFENEPIIPCEFLVHSLRLQEDQLTFLNAITKSIANGEKRVNVVTDQELSSKMFSLVVNICTVGTTLLKIFEGVLHGPYAMNCLINAHLSSV